MCFMLCPNKKCVGLFFTKQTVTAIVPCLTDNLYLLQPSTDQLRQQEVQNIHSQSENNLTLTLLKMNIK
jgi:hypothetical protein